MQALPGIRSAGGGLIVLSLFGKRALVTGGSRGIGLAAAQALAEAGADVVINHCRDTDKASAEVERLAMETGRSIGHLDADIGNYHTARGLVDRAADQLGGLDICISNAGICQYTSFLEIDEACWERHVATNFSGGFFVGQRAAQVMAEAKNGGRIVFTTSVGAFQSNATQTHYCATKGGLHLLSLGMAIELAPLGITVNCIAPGWIHTDLTEKESMDPNVFKPWLEWNCPMGRLGKPQDCAGAILFFCAKEASYVTGSTIFVDGGWMSKL
jgi:NAD(P)-dependent dehydrogenase (short-subunit alcohol dehydrogenase family)